jgi:predicted oxidoreductase
MQTMRIAKTDLEVSRLAYGCMQLGAPWDRTPFGEADVARAERLVHTVLDKGINFFDHADIYTYGKSEATFGEVLRRQPALREQMVLQTKCGIRFSDDPRPGDPARYDFSYEHIVRAVAGSLKRLQTDHVDLLLLHRPDALVEPEEVARAFDELERSGQVRYFGVSNHTPGQIELLRRWVRQPLVVNQVELSLLHAPLINDGIVANQAPGAYQAAAGTLDYCRLHDITVQAWGPVANGRLIDPPSRAEPRVRAAAKAVAEMAKAKGTSREAIALAWLLRHPAQIQPIVGTSKAARIVASCQADEVRLSREEWYRLFAAARGAPMP